MEPRRLRDDRRHRRYIIAASFIGMGAMGAVSALQTGIINHLPDPPIRGFDSDTVNTSDSAYRFNVPDGTVSLAGLAANIPIAAFGDRSRAETHPWIPLLAAAKAAIEAGAAGWYYYQMPTKRKAWCGYCILGALVNVGILAPTLPEATRAATTIFERWTSR